MMYNINVLSFPIFQDKDSHNSALPVRIACWVNRENSKGVPTAQDLKVRFANVIASRITQHAPLTVNRYIGAKDCTLGKCRSQASTGTRMPVNLQRLSVSYIARPAASLSSLKFACTFS